MESMTVAEAAEKMGASQMYVRIGLRNNRLPFGSAVKNGSRWNYHISRKAFERYISGNNIDVDQIVDSVIKGIVDKIIEIYG